MSFDPYASNPQPQPANTPQYDPYGPRPAASRTWLWVVLGLAGLAMTCCCGGTVGVVMLGVNILEAEVKDRLRDNPKLREAIGEVESIDADITGSLAAKGENTYRYRVRGSKGSGELTVTQHTDDNGDEVIDEATLRLPDGRQVQIMP